MLIKHVRENMTRITFQEHLDYLDQSDLLKVTEKYVSGRSSVTCFQKGRKFSVFHGCLGKES